MNLDIHPGVKAVAEFMQRTLPADQLVGTASALAAVAPCLWGQHPAEDVFPLSLKEKPIGG